MVTRQSLAQYSDLRGEIKEVKSEIETLNGIIERNADHINETVKDKVSGGMGGIQHFEIEGIPAKRNKNKKTDLLSKKLLLNKRKATLEKLEIELLRQTNEIDEFISSIDDSRIRRIIHLRFVRGLPWNKVADQIGGGNTEDSVRMAFHRFMKNI